MVCLMKKYWKQINVILRWIEGVNRNIQLIMFSWGYPSDLVPRGVEQIILEIFSYNSKNWKMLGVSLKAIGATFHKEPGNSILTRNLSMNNSMVSLRYDQLKEKLLQAIYAKLMV